MKTIKQEQIDTLIQYLKQSVLPSRDVEAISALLKDLPELKEQSNGEK